MDGRYPPYPQYKPSGVDWLGEIPAHWEVRRLKFVASVVYSNVDKHTKEGEFPVRLCNYVDVYKNERITQDLPFMEATASLDELRRFALKKGDVIITKDSEEWQDIAVPALVDEDLRNVICGYHLALIRPYQDTADSGYLFRSFQAAAINYQFQIAASGITRYGLGKQSLGNAVLLLPPLPEQRAIAAYLDRETARIDALIAHKRDLLALLERQRAALISHAVTKGLNPDVPRKPSGVDWLGEIPAHWEVTKVKKLAGNSKNVVQTGPFGAQLHSSDYVEEGVPLILIKNVKDYFIDDTDIPKVTLDDASRLSMYRLEVGDIVFSRVGSIGRMALVTKREKGWLISGQMLRLRLVRNDLDHKFMLYAISSESVLQAIALESVGSTRESINTEILRNLEIPLPPLPEQRAIAAYLDRETARIDALKGEIQESIDLLQGYRAALISAAVTGKMDVRGMPLW